MARGGRKSAADALLAASLAAGASQEEAATAAGVSVRTVARRLADPAFRRLVDRAQDALLERFAGGMAGRLGSVLDRLAELVGSAKEVVALGACRTLADVLIRVREHTGLARRLGELERAADEPDGPAEGGGEEDGGPPDEPGLPDRPEGGPVGGPEAGEGGS
jgi:hypothetical protein